MKLVPVLTGVSMIDPSDGVRRIITNFRLGGYLVTEGGKPYWKNDDGTLEPVQLRDMTDEDKAQNWSR